MLFLSLTPLIGSVAAYFLLGEALSMKLLLGLAFTVAGLYIAFR